MSLRVGGSGSGAIVVGGGIVGLAVAARLQRTRPGLDVTVLEKDDHPGQQQTSHNSGVVHAGIYYTPGSLKAALCTEGRTLMRSYCEEKRIPYEACGKVVVAVDQREQGRLLDLHQRATANGVPGVELIGPAALRDIEPAVVGLGAVWSPETAITDFGAVARSLAADIEAAGGQVLTGRRVVGLTEGADGVDVELSGAPPIRGQTVVVCGGLHGDRLAARSGGSSDPKIVPFRGEYWKLRATRRHLVQGLVYPVPDPSLPFLGIHLTKRIDGEVLVGPNAVLALSREGYRWRDISPADLLETLTYPGVWAVARRHWRTAAGELLRSVSKRAFLRDAQQYVPSLDLADVERAHAGVRAQAVGRNGTLLDDFLIERQGRVVFVRNAPSPAATSSLAIARHVVDQLPLT